MNASQNRQSEIDLQIVYINAMISALCALYYEFCDKNAWYATIWSDSVRVGGQYICADIFQDIPNFKVPISDLWIEYKRKLGKNSKRTTNLRLPIWLTPKICDLN